LAKPEEGEARELSRSFLPEGALLRGKYRIDGVIGTGGMAVVYAATHRNRKRFALKMLHPELSTRAEIRARFVREGYVANSVEHAGVVSVLDDDVTEDGSAFLVMELLEGATLERLAPRAHPLPLRESLAIAIDVLDVLEAAHGKGIVHRDIKPANLFVTRAGQLKVLDFGIARLRDATLAAKSTATGALLGTPAFMAPEQALALAGEIDARTDLWAVGATLFTLLSGSLVHEGGNARQIMIRAATEPARSLSSVAPDLPAAVTQWVSKALLFDKLARWESAAAMRAAAQQIYGDLFGPAEEGCAKRLFELSALDIAHSPTELSPTAVLRSVVRDTTRTTLRSLPGKQEASRSVPAWRLEALAAPHERGRWLPAALIGSAALALGVWLVLGLARPTRAIETSLSAASPSPTTTASSSSAASDVGSSLARPPATESSPASASATGSDVPARPTATSASARALIGPASVSRTSRASPVTDRSRLLAPSARVEVRASPTASAQPSELPSSPKPAATAAQRNPLQLEIQ
jgi:eukaryotic-like serine/threonine-protein kinase